MEAPAETPKIPLRRNILRLIGMSLTATVSLFAADIAAQVLVDGYESNAAAIITIMGAVVGSSATVAKDLVGAT